ncbi:ubiquitin carboxyl-terminal hydrolase 34 [Brachionus plicatilis]|uniref:Ubiquitin carboxyl-terminal hydrolase 34 n=1 Tax=Brachionus plicatilis TaxID=10195 RepID=A0A3M7PIB4_BRAPC|nr:ubiquitin carboxyl-terminal hydrolase 34 [Brachionus plicatilis]
MIKLKTFSPNANSSESNRLNLSDLSEPGNTFLWDLLMNQSSEVKETHLKIVKEAEKQFQIIICLPTTDRRIKFKFIESCIKNIHNADTCPIALRLLTKIFSSFQQCTANTFNFLCEFKNAKKLQPSKPVTDMHTSLFSAHHSTQPANEIHKAVALADFKFNLISEFFISLGNLDRSKEQHMQIQARLQFLSFIYSTIGSVAAFDLSVQNVNDLWSCLAKFEHSSQIKDDIFNWFLSQAKNKDQHALSVDNLKLIFVHKMPVLEPNNFSLSALHLYQELFKIYKSSSGENEEQAKQMEQSAIDYILKLAFKSTLNDVSLSAIQFLNSHHCNNEGEFVQKCLEYLKKSRHRLQSGDCVETSLVEIQRGLLLLKNHLDLSQRKNSYRIRLLQIKEPGYLNHSKCLIDYDKWDGLIRFVCHVNSTRFNFELVMTLSDCVGDLKAVVREILLNCIKSGKEMGSDLVENSDCDKLVFNSNNLNDVDLCKQAYSNLVQELPYHCQSLSKKNISSKIEKGMKLVLKINKTRDM